MHTDAVVLTAPGEIAVRRIALNPPAGTDVVVDIAWSGISTGTERLLYTGRMPPFPGMGYPLVPGYESVGRVRDAGRDSGLAEGQLVYVPGANCYGDIRGLFGGTAAHLVTGAARLIKLPESMAAAGGETGTLLALAATAQHAIALPGLALPDLIIGHGTVGRLLARLAVAAGATPTIWEVQKSRRDGAMGYQVIDPAEDTRRDYRCIIDASGDASLLDTLIGKLAPGGAIVLAGFYDQISFAFPPAFMREARILIAAQFLPADLRTVLRLVESGALSLDGLITHRARAADASDAYNIAFYDSDCLKMLLDWRDFA